MKNYLTNLTLLLSIAFLSSCHSDGGDKEVVLTDTATARMEISEELMNGIIQSIPSPLEMSSALKYSGCEYNNSFLNPTENSDKYVIENKKAFNLGVYGADLAYINIYEKTIYALNYLNSIKRLADDLKIGHFFDIATMKRLSTNSKNIDSLLFLSTSNFNKMDNYLRENKRGNLSVLMISGAWLESVYLANKVYETKHSEEIKNQISEQKIVLDNLILVINAYKSSSYFADLGKDFERLKVEFDKIKITTEYRQPVSKEVNGKLVIEDNSKTSIEVPEGVLESINAVVSEIRNKQIQ